MKWLRWFSFCPGNGADMRRKTKEAKTFLLSVETVTRNMMGNRCGVQASDSNGYKKNCGVCNMKCPLPGQPQGETPTCKNLYCRKGACSCAMCKMTKNHKAEPDAEVASK